MIVRFGRIARETVLTLGAIAGIACVVLALLPVFGVRPLVVTSGSMEPEISTGALAFARSVDADAVRVGDVVSVRDEAGARVTHRVDSINTDDGSVRLTLRGDANAVPDARAYEIDRADRVLFSVDGLGYVLGWLRTPVGVLIAGLIAMGLLWLGFRDAGVAPRQPRSGRTTAIAGATALALVAVAGASAYGLGAAEPTRAAWADQGAARTGTFGATTVLPLEAVQCKNEGGLLGLLGYAQLTWPHRATGYSYAYTITRVSNGQVVGGGSVSATGGVGSTVVLDVSTALLGNNLLTNTQYDVTVRSLLAASPNWQSATSRTARVHSVNLLVGLSMRCGSGNANRVSSSTHDHQLLTTNLEQ